MAITANVRAQRYAAFSLYTQLYINSLNDVDMFAELFTNTHVTKVCIRNNFPKCQR